MEDFHRKKKSGLIFICFPRNSAVPKAEEESELDQSTSSVVSTTSTRGRRTGSAVALASGT